MMNETKNIGEKKTVDEKKKESVIGGGLYIALAICILSVICVGVYSAVINIVGTGASGVPEVRDPVAAPSASAAPAAETPRKDPLFPSEKDKTVSVDPVEPDTEGSGTGVGSDAPASVPEVTSFTRPLGTYVAKPYSENELLYSATMNDYRTHLGTDYPANPGEAVHCFAAGTVEKVYEDPLMGQTVVVDHGNGLKSVYQNLAVELPDGIEPGKAVREGEVIAGVGETGLVECEEETHLHFSVTVDGVPVDPESYFK